MAVSWKSGYTYVAREDDPDIVLWSSASAAFPGLFLPVTVRGEQWADGGLRGSTPLGEAIRLGADEVDVVCCSNPDLFLPFDEKAAAIPARVERSLDIMTAQIEQSDFAMCGYKNALAEINPKYRKVKLRILQPQVILPSPLDFTQKTIQYNMQQGYEDACKLEVL